MQTSVGELTLITSSINGECKFKVVDNGIGIYEENLEHIFTVLLQESRRDEIGLVDNNRYITLKKCAAGC